MSSSRDFSDGRLPGKAPEKSNFAQTCNLLSRYIKEKGSLRDLNLEIGGKVESLEAIVKPGSTHFVSASTSMNIISNKGNSAEEQISMAPDSSINTVEEDASYKLTSKEGTTADPKTAPLTIFYSGRVLVFEDYPEDKAKELLAFAKKGSSQISYGIWSNTLREKSSPGAAVASAASSPREGLPPRPQAGSSHKGGGISLNTCKEKMNNTVSEVVGTSSNPEQRVAPQAQANGSDLPIARRSSLHRFLEKRKDRAAVRGPYQVQEQPASSSKGDEQLDLKL